jgi:probable F420-dependent oxidoreductase
MAERPTLSIQLTNFAVDDPGGWEPLLERARLADRVGVDRVVVSDHVVFGEDLDAYGEPDTGGTTGGRQPTGPDGHWLEPLTLLTAVAATTDRVRLGTGILLAALRRPAVLAKQVATLDVLSGGRVELGVGVGWLEEEFRVLGVPFERRGKRTDEHIGAMRALWTQELPTYQGEMVSFEHAISRPQPVQGAVPITIGGHTSAAARRAGRLGDGFFPGRGSHDDLQQLFGEVRTAAEEHGRDPDAIELTAGGRGTPGDQGVEEVRALAELGVDRVVIPPLAFDPDGLRDALARFGDEVIAKAG